MRVLDTADVPHYVLNIAHLTNSRPVGKIHIRNISSISNKDSIIRHNNIISRSNSSKKRQGINNVT